MENSTKLVDQKHVEDIVDVERYNFSPIMFDAVDRQHFLLLMEYRANQKRFLELKAADSKLTVQMDYTDPLSRLLKQSLRFEGKQI
jgi:hypothetical protein